MIVHDSYEVGGLEAGYGVRSQSRSEYGQTARCRDLLPFLDDLGKDNVELVTQDGLQSSSLGAQAAVLTP